MPWLIWVVVKVAVPPCMMNSRSCCGCEDGCGACGAGADDFLPVLIWVVVKAAPPQLASNLEYIQRFRTASRFTAEFAYFYTQLVRCSAGSVRGFHFWGSCLLLHPAASALLHGLLLYCRRCVS